MTLTTDPEMVETLDDGLLWERRHVTEAGRGLYAIAGAVSTCPSYVLPTLTELAVHGIRRRSLCAECLLFPAQLGSPWCSTTCRNRDDRHDDGGRDA